MGSYGGFYYGDKKKKKKGTLEKKTKNLVSKSTFILPKVEIIKKGKNET